MSEITRILDAEGKPTLKYRATLLSLARPLLKGEGLIFLGAGAAACTDGLPTARELSQRFAEQCRLE